MTHMGQTSVSFTYKFIRFKLSNLCGLVTGVKLRTGRPGLELGSFSMVNVWNEMQE